MKKGLNQKSYNSNHIDHSNKNISINICYNLNSPKFNMIKQNFLNTKQVESTIKGKKILNKDIILQRQSFQPLRSQALEGRYQQLSHFRKQKLLTKSEMHDWDEQRVQNECISSVKILKKKKSANQSNSKIGHHQKFVLKSLNTHISSKQKKRFEPSINIPISDTNKTNKKKRFFDSVEPKYDIQVSELFKIYRQQKMKKQRSKERSESKKRSKSENNKHISKKVTQNKQIIQEVIKKLKKKDDSYENIQKRNFKKNKFNKSFIYDKNQKLKTENSGIQTAFKKKKPQKFEKPKKFIKSKSTEKSMKKKDMQGQVQIKKGKKNFKINDYSQQQVRDEQYNRNQQNLQNLIVQKMVASSMSYSIKNSELTSKNQSDRKLQESVSTPNSSMDIIQNIKQIRQLQQQVPLKQKKQNLGEIDRLELESIIKIQRWWRQRTKRKIIRYYSHIFHKNRNSEISDIDIFQNLDNGQLDKISDFEIEKIQLERIKKLKENNQKLDESFFGSYKSEQQDEQNSYISHQPKSKTSNQEQQSRFDINKYQEFVQKSLKEEKIKQQQIQSNQVIHIKKQSQEIYRFKQHQVEQWNHINRLINRQLNNRNQIDQQSLLHQLMKQSQLNKKWIQQSCDQIVTPRNEQSIKQSKSSQKSDNYRALIDQTGIAEKIKKNRLNGLFNSFDFMKYRKPTIRSLSTDNLNKQFLVQQIIAKESSCKENKQNLEDNLLKNRKTSKQKSQLIQNYLDCGLIEFGMPESEHIANIDETIQESLRKSQEIRKKIKNAVAAYDENNAMEVPQCQKQGEFMQDNIQKNQSLMNYQWNRLNLQMLIKNLNEQIECNDRINEGELQKSEVDDESISKKFNQQKFSKHTVFQLIYREIIDQFIDQAQQKQRMQRQIRKNTASYISKFNKAKGIPTNIQSIKIYLSKFIQFILTNQEQRESALKNFNSILGPSSAEMLYYLRIQDYSNISSQSDDDDTILIISLNTFQKFEKIFLQGLTKDIGGMNPKLQSIAHSWHRALFQSFNQALDYQRPYGIHGKPYAWQIQYKIKNVPVTEKNLQKVLKIALNRVIEITDNLSGLMFQKQDNSFYGLDLIEQYKIQINQERLSRMLTNELVQAQQSWINYNDELTQIMMQISHMISERILFQSTAQLKKLRKKRLSDNDF